MNSEEECGMYMLDTEISIDAAQEDDIPKYIDC